VEIAEGTSVHMTRRGIAAVLPPEGEDGEEPEIVDAEPFEEPDLDEVPVTGGEEPVTGQSDAETAAADRR